MHTPPSLALTISSKLVCHHPCLVRTNKQTNKSPKCKTWNYPQEFRCARCGKADPNQQERRGDDGSVGDDSRSGSREYHGYYSGGGGGDPRRVDSRPYDDTTTSYSSSARRSNSSHNDHHPPYEPCNSDDRPLPCDCPSKNASDDDNDGIDDQGVDEFGRSLKGKPPPKSKSTTTTTTTTIEWPPAFEKDGTAFVLDSRCGMFYEPRSDFFYDPKSKLYYGNKKGTYYQYHATTQSFEAVDSGPSKEHSSSVDPEPLLGTTNLEDNPSSKKQITIKLKTKSLKKSSSKEVGATPPPTVVGAASTSSSPLSSELDRVRKQHEADIQKWSSAAARGGTERTLPTSGAAPDATTTALPSRTIKGEPICVVCRRKFPTLEKLLYHEKASQLHKDNLAKMQQSTASRKEGLTAGTAPNDSTQSEYTDRAQQRRDMFGSAGSMGGISTHDPTAVFPPPNDTDATTTLNTSSPTYDPLGAGTVGRQMLEKLGWKGGAVLSGQKRSHDDSVTRQMQQHESLKREWDRCTTTTAAAAGGGGAGHKRPPSNNAGLGASR